MDPKYLRSLYGRRCRARVHCHGCGRVHTLTGTLRPGRRSGDVAVDGQTYPTSDLVSVTPVTPPARARMAVRPMLPLLWAALALLAWLQVLAHR